MKVLHSVYRGYGIYKENNGYIVETPDGHMELADLSNNRYLEDVDWAKSVIDNFEVTGSNYIRVVQGPVLIHSDPIMSESLFKRLFK